MKKWLWSCLCALLICVCGVAGQSLVAKADGAVQQDDFSAINNEQSIAVEKSGVSFNADAVHGAIPTNEWNNPLILADSSYLIYEAPASEEVFFYFKAKIWNQNDDRCHVENSVRISVSDSLEGEYSLVKAYLPSDAKGTEFIAEDELDLSDAIEGDGKTYVKLEMIQSRATCDNASCTQGNHTCGKTLATADGMIDIHFLGVKLFEVKMSTAGSIVDREQPLPNDFKQQLPAEGYVSQTFTFPEIVFTDNVDGNTDYFITMVDPYNISTQLPKNATSFFPEYEGMYSFEISSSDSAGNTYIDKFSLRCVLADDAPMIYHENFPEKNGRVGVPYILEPLCYNRDELEELDIYVLSPEGNRIEVAEDRFTPTQVGEYRVVYSASNAYGTTKLLVRVYVKYDIGDVSPYQAAIDVAHWSGNASQDDEGILVTGDAYCNVPLSLAAGLNLSVTLPESGFMSLSFTQRAENSIYSFNLSDYSARGNAPGLYVLFYPQSDGYFYYNVTSVGLSGMAMEVANHAPCGIKTDGDRKLTVALKKNPHTEDNIQLFVNGALNENYELCYTVLASVCSDNEGFSYISMGCPDGVNTFSFDGIANYDSEPPVIQIGGLAESYALGTTITLPTVSAVDSNDGEVSHSAVLYSPMGKQITATDNAFVADVEGIWYYIVSAMDAAGNRTSQFLEIKVGNTEKTRVLEETTEQEEEKSGCSNCKSSINLGALGLLPLAAFVINKKKRDSHE